MAYDDDDDDDGDDDDDYDDDGPPVLEAIGPIAEGHSMDLGPPVLEPSIMLAEVSLLIAYYVINAYS